ncbi:hypothetical protein GCM10009827_055980 [Dactylosporangium maewongense]|uniref:Uncharacterized protein n=1 Tax=Dactylosporangium maewongense TaxID=634393 RepID=A0ABP4LT65_9ACTN
MNDVRDIDEIRALRARFDQPANLARARARVLAGTGERTARRSPARSWVPALAGVVVVGLVVAVALVARGTDTAPLRPGGAGTPSLPASAEEWARPVDALVRLALAGPAAAEVHAGQHIRSEVRLFDNGIRRTETSLYEPEGLILTTTAAEYVQQQRTTFAKDGPSLRQPTPEYLAGLAADPGRLRTMLLDAPCPPSGCTDEVRAWFAWNLVSDLARTADVITPPALRSALLRILTGLPGVTLGRETIDDVGHSALSITVKGDQTHRLILDEHVRIAGAMTVAGSSYSLSLWTTTLVD